MRTINTNTKNIKNNAKKTVCPVASESITRCGYSDDATTPVKGKSIMKSVTLDQLKKLSKIVGECRDYNKMCDKEVIETCRKLRAALKDMGEAEEASRNAAKIHEGTKVIFSQVIQEFNASCGKAVRAIKVIKTAEKEYNKSFAMAPKSVQDELLPYLSGEK